MSDLKSLAGGVLNLVESLGPALAPGIAAKTGVAIAGVQAVRAFIATAKTVVRADPEAVAALDAGRDAFEARVNAKVDAAIDRLRGK